MVGSWMRAGYYFDVPTVNLTLHFRSPLGRQLHALLVPAKDDIEEVGKRITSFIEYHRPDLKGLTVVMMNADPRRMQWELTVVHPSLPKQKPFEVAYQRLETCTECNGPLSGDVEAMRWMGARGEVCSEHCVKVSERYRTDDIVIVEGGVRDEQR